MLRFATAALALAAAAQGGARAGLNEEQLELLRVLRLADLSAA